MDENEADQRRVAGYVKWFDPSKGFGFVVADEGGPDILLHANVLRNYGQSSVADGAGIEVLVQSTPRGAQAVEVLSIEPVAGEAAAEPNGDSSFAEPVDLSLPLEPSRVKWFDKAKGFGFANPDRGLEASPATIYSICSISKLFTSVAVMQLRDQGKLSLDEPLSTYLPWYRIKDKYPDAPLVDLRGILTHSAGLPREAGFEDVRYIPVVAYRSLITARKPAGS